MELGEYLPVLRTTNARFDDAAAEAVLAHGWSAPVPGCPDWRLADLVRHVAEVQHFWAWVVRTRRRDPSAYPEPPRHPDDELLGWLDAQHAELETALAGADPAERVWTWAPQQDVAFVLRRQAARGGGAHRRRRAGARRRPADPGRASGWTGSTSGWRSWCPARCRTGRPTARTRWCSTPWTPAPSAPSSPAAGRSRSPP